MEIPNWMESQKIMFQTTNQESIDPCADLQFSHKSDLLSDPYLISSR